MVGVSSNDPSTVPQPSEATSDTPVRQVERHPYRWVIIGQIWLHSMLAQITTTGLGVLLLGISSELGLGPGESGWLGATRTAGALIVFPMSFVLVRFAPKRLYGALTFGLGLSMVLAGFAPGFWTLFACQVVFSLCFALAQVPVSLLRTQWIPSRELGRVWGTGNALNAVAQMSVLVGVPLVLGILGGWRGVLQGGGVVMLIAAAAWQVTGRERAEEHAAGPQSSFAAIRRPEYYILGLASVGGAMSYLACLFFLPVFLVQERGLSLETAGLISAILPAAGLISNVSAGFLSDRVGRRKPFIWPSGLLLPPLYFLAVSPIPVWAVLLVVSLVGFFAWQPFPAISSISFELPGVRPSDIAVGAALMQMISGVGIICGPIIVGQIAEATGSLRPGIIAVGVFPVLFAVTCLWLPDTGPKARAAA